MSKVTITDIIRELGKTFPTTARDYDIPMPVETTSSHSTIPDEQIEFSANNNLLLLRRYKDGVPRTDLRAYGPYAYMLVRLPAGVHPSKLAETGYPIPRQLQYQKVPGEPVRSTQPDEYLTNHAITKANAVLPIKKRNYAANHAIIGNLTKRVDQLEQLLDHQARQLTIRATQYNNEVEQLKTAVDLAIRQGQDHIRLFATALMRVESDMTTLIELSLKSSNEAYDRTEIPDEGLPTSTTSDAMATSHLLVRQLAMAYRQVENTRRTTDTQPNLMRSWNILVTYKDTIFKYIDRVAGNNKQQ
jgi:hypothetical protein